MLPLLLPFLLLVQDSRPATAPSSMPATATVGRPAALVALEDELSLDRLRFHLTFLASDEMQGRAAGSRAGHVVAEYLALQLELAGLEPAGSDGWFQDFEFSKGYEVAGTPALAVAGTGLRNGDDFVVLPGAGSGEVDGNLLFAGYGLNFPGGEGAHFSWDDYEGIDPKGRVLLIVAGGPEVGGVRLESSITRKIYTAKAKGAAAVILVDPAREGALPSYASARASAGIPGLHLSMEALKRLAPEQAARVRDFVDGKEGKAPDGPRAALSLALRKVTAEGRNVLGRLQGADPALRDEYVVLGAHFDHLGLGGSSSLAPGGGVGQVHNGADDNASGTSLLLEVARAMAAGPRPKRSILFACFDAEELGLLGSAHFTAEPTVPLGSIRAMVNLDMVGRGKEGYVAVIGAGTSPVFGKLLEDIAPDGSVRASDSSMGGSDHQSFHAKRIPAVHFFTGTHAQYHRPEDDTALIDFASMRRVGAVVLALMRRLAAFDGELPFVEPVKTTAPEVRASGPRPYLGTIPDYVEGKGGVKLSGVTPGSPVAQAGLEAGDVIVGVDDKKVDDIYDFSYALQAMKPGQKIVLRVRRGGKVLRFDCVVGAR
ncbi:MAG: M28 family peptidase [Planctomycetota bacterium]